MRLWQLLINENAVARADERPEGASRTREGVSRPEQRGGRLTRLGRREVRLLCVPASEASGSTEVAARAAKRAGTSSGGAGLKGAVGSGKTAEVSTAANGVSEERNEALDRSRLGLWRCSPPIRQRLFISERLGALEMFAADPPATIYK